MAAIMRTAKNVTADLRATVTESPRRSSAAQSHPPKRLPKPATRNGIQPYLPIEAMSKPRDRLRYSGNQKM